MMIDIEFKEELKMRIKNFTPHTINLFDGDVQTRVIKSDGLARVSQTRRQVGNIDNIPVFISKFGEVEGLPTQQDGTSVIVSRIVFTASGRSDLICVDDAVRDSQGRVVGCRAFSR